MASADFDQAIAESHAATDGVLKGNPGGFKALYSRSEDITLREPTRRLRTRVGPGGRAARACLLLLPGRGSHRIRVGRAGRRLRVGLHGRTRTGQGQGCRQLRRQGVRCSSYVDLSQRRGRLATHPSSCRSQGLPPDRRVRARGVGAYRSQSRTAMPKRTHLVLRDAQTPRRSHGACRGALGPRQSGAETRRSGNGLYALPRLPRRRR